MPTKGSHLRQLGGILRDETKVDPKLVDMTLCQQANAREKINDTRFFRVQADQRPTQASGEAVLLETMHGMSSLVEEICHSSVVLRTLTIGERCTPYERVVRDLASELGQELRLKIKGGDTEMDNSVVEKNSDPLMHLVRNALADGLETPAKSQAVEGRLTSRQATFDPADFQPERRIKFYVSPQQLGYH